MIVSDPKSGYVLALANAPDFDPNLFFEADLATQRNRALSDLYEPGSTFKIVPVCGALNEGLVSADCLVDCSKSTYRRGSKLLRLPSDHKPLGEISVSKVVQKSSNRGVAQLGIKLGAEGCMIIARHLALEVKPVGIGESGGECFMLEKLGWFDYNEITYGACGECYCHADSPSDVGSGKRRDSYETPIR